MRSLSKQAQKKVRKYGDHHHPEEAEQEGESRPAVWMTAFAHFSRVRRKTSSPGRMGNWSF
jgi:hypothetical protein